jgi:hypothetical protein
MTARGLLFGFALFEWCLKIRFELLRDFDECDCDSLSPISSHFCSLEIGTGAVIVHMVAGFKQLFGGLDDHGLLKGLYWSLQGM